MVTSILEDQQHMFGVNSTVCS